MIRPDPLSIMITDTSGYLYAIAEQLAILTNKLRNSTDSENRRGLLREFRVLLAEADKIITLETSGK
jgi:hypothetical protein